MSRYIIMSDIFFKKYGFGAALSALRGLRVCELRSVLEFVIEP